MPEAAPVKTAPGRKCDVRSSGVDVSDRLGALSNVAGSRHILLMAQRGRCQTLVLRA
jgi:hypothetical protein